MATSEGNNNDGFELENNNAQQSYSDLSYSSDDSEEEEVNVYDGLGNTVNLEPNARKVVSKVPLARRRGIRGKKFVKIYMYIFAVHVA